jgi:hypothetical protein
MDDLVKHYSLERVSLEEFERRTERVSKGASRGEVLAQVADLPPLRPERSAKPESASATWRIAARDPRPNDFAVAVFSGTEYKGVWQAPRNLGSLCVFGGSNIDFRKAVVPAEGVTVSCLCVFGGVDIIVPPGMNVRVRGFAVFGGFDRPNHEIDDPNAPTINVEGLALFGGVSVRVRQ